MAGGRPVDRRPATRRTKGLPTLATQGKIEFWSPEAPGSSAATSSTGSWRGTPATRRRRRQLLPRQRGQPHRRAGHAPGSRGRPPRCVRPGGHAGRGGIVAEIDTVFDFAVIPLPTSLTYPGWTVATNVGIVTTFCEIARRGIIERLVHVSQLRGVRLGTLRADGRGPPARRDHAVRRQQVGGRPHHRSRTFRRSGSTPPWSARSTTSGRARTPGSYAGIIPIVVRKVLEASRSRSIGDGEQTRDFIYASHTADTIVKVFDSPACRSQVLNVATGVETSINDLGRMLLDVLESPDHPVVHAPERPGRRAPPLCRYLQVQRPGLPPGPATQRGRPGGDGLVVPAATVVRLNVPLVGTEELIELRRVLESGYLTQGKETQPFEEMVRAQVATSHAFATSSATTGLHLALHALGIGPGDEVIMPAFSFPATANAVIQLGAIPVFVDIDVAHVQHRPDSLESAITARTTAVMPVHAFGLTADMDPINAFARGHSASGTRGCRVCARGSLPRPPGGEPRYRGRLLVPSSQDHHHRRGRDGHHDDPQLAERIQVLRSHGGVRGALYMDFVDAGYNYRLSDVHAAIGVAQMGRLRHITAERARLAAELTVRLRESPLLETPRTPPGLRARLPVVRRTSRRRRRPRCGHTLHEGTRNRNHARYVRDAPTALLPQSILPPTRDLPRRNSRSSPGAHAPHVSRHERRRPRPARRRTRSKHRRREKLTRESVMTAIRQPEDFREICEAPR